MKDFTYTSVDRVFSKLYREIPDENLHESDVIEWIGEALDFLKVPQIQEEAVLFGEVKNHELDLPVGFHSILQISRHNNWTPKTKESCVVPSDPNVTPPYKTPIKEDSDEDCWYCEPDECYKPYFDMQWQYIPWTRSTYYYEHFSPVRLANNTFFNSLVCREKDLSIYDGCVDEYTIVGDTSKKLRFSFKEGYVAVSHLRSVMDKDTGYPLIPDNISYITAITYYVKWKLAQRYQWSGREGFNNLAIDNERLWLKYVQQAKNYAKMPKSIDDYQNLLEQTHQLIPNNRRYYNYFGNLGRPDPQRYDDPFYRNRYFNNEFYQRVY